jgi:hypothetical protein
MMLDEAWAVLKKLSPREQELLAEAVLDYVARRPNFGLTDGQVAIVEARLREMDPKTVTVGELRARLLGS